MSPIQCSVEHVRDNMPANSDDDVVYDYAGKMNGVVVTYDRDFKEISQKAKLYTQHKVGVFYFRSSRKSLRYWELVVAFISQWEELKKMAAETEKPFVFEISKNGVSKKNL